MNTRSLRLGLLSALLVVSPLSVSDAQRARQGGGGERQAGARANRQQLEQRFRMRLANLLRTQLGLTDEGMRQLSEVNQRFDVQRRDPSLWDDADPDGVYGGWLDGATEA